MSAAESPFREILLTAGTTRAKVAPERGGMVTSFSVNGHEVLFLDRNTFTDPARNVCGGIPVLFPNVGPRSGKPSTLEQQGFAQKMPFEVLNKTERSVLMRLVQNADSRKQYPYDFDLRLHVQVMQTGALEHTVSIANNGRALMSTAYGINPHFAIPESVKRSLKTNITGFKARHVNWEEWEFDEYFPNPESLRIRIPENEATPLRELRIESGPEFRIVYVHSQPGTNAVCFEPWTQEADALHQSRALLIQSHSGLILPIKISAQTQP